MSKWPLAIKLLAAVAVLAIVIGIGYIGLELTSTSSFCRSCHVMEDQYQSWLHSAHRTAAKSCSECHVPHSFIPKVLYKIKSGTHDIYVNLTGPPDVIRANDETRRVVTDNCRRCHAAIVSKINVGDRFCSDCHRFTPHGGR